MKQIKFSKDARSGLIAGINILANAVRVTLGPHGRYVVVDDNDTLQPVITNDGVTIARHVESEDPIELQGLRLAREASEATNKVAGDGTTTAIILTQALVNAGLMAMESPMYRAEPVKYDSCWGGDGGKRMAVTAVPTVVTKVDNGVSAVKMRTQLEADLEKVVAHVRSVARPIEGHADISRVATISSRDPKVGKVIADAYELVGREGTVTVEDGSGFGLELIHTEGMTVPEGYVSPYMASEDSEVADLHEPFVLITDEKISSVNALVPALKHAMEAGRPILIIAESCTSEVQSALALNQQKGVVHAVVIRAPGRGDYRRRLLEDIGVLCKGRVIGKDSGRRITAMTAADLGEARRITVTDSETTIVDGAGKEFVQKRVEQLQSALEAATGVEADSIRKRLSGLSGGVAVIKIGAATETEATEVKFRLEDALLAVRAAIKEGVVPGGGECIYRYASNWSGEISMPMAEALKAPVRQLMANAGVEGMPEEFFTNHVGDDVIDPALVVISALSNAVSIAKNILVTECSISYVPMKLGR